MTLSLRDIIAGYNPNAPLSKAATPPASWYVDPRIFDLEKRTVFPYSWQIVARAAQVRDAGQYITAEIAGEPILVVRGNDRLLRGFFNVCRHHAAAVVTDPEGKTQSLRCPYHGWTYNLEGTLIITPEFAGVRNFERSANGLLPIQTDVWEGWIFVKLDRNGPSLKEFLGKELINKIQPLGLDKLHWTERRYYTVNCNWKVFIDNYLDGGYHVPHIHSGLNSVLDYTHYTIETGEHWCVQSSPITSDKGEEQTAAVRTGESAFYYWIYPNLMINWYEGLMDTNLVCPRGVDRTEVIIDFYFADISNSARERNLASIAVSERIQAEDKAICESVQSGLSSRAFTAGRLSVRREAGGHLFHRLLYTDLKTDVSDEDPLK
jgi:phenylpropionate dioxygenase-like ring-hydroxylating dioxygenase large terminal subunit